MSPQRRAEPPKTPSARAQLAAVLTPALPPEWVVIPHEPKLDAQIGKTSLYISQQTISRHRAAPMGKQLVTFTLRVITPDTAVETREDGLEDAVSELLFELEHLGPAFAWTEANKVMHGAYLAYDVDLTMIGNKPQPTNRKGA